MRSQASLRIQPVGPTTYFGLVTTFDRTRLSSYLNRSSKMADDPPIRVTSIQITEAPSALDSEIGGLGAQRGDWGIGVALRFSVDGDLATKSQDGDDSSKALYIHQYLEGNGILWNEAGATKRWHIEVSEYFKLKKRTGNKWTTVPDKHNNWYRPGKRRGYFKPDPKGGDDSWCGMSIHVQGTLRVGRLYEQSGDGKRKAFTGDFAFDESKLESSGSRTRVGVPDGSVPGVVDVQAQGQVPEGGLVFKPDPLFPTHHYEYWITRDNCGKKLKNPPRCGNPPRSITPRRRGELEWRETRTVGGPPPDRSKKPK